MNSMIMPLLVHVDVDANQEQLTADQDFEHQLQSQLVALEVLTQSLDESLKPAGFHEYDQDVVDECANYGVEIVVVVLAPLVEVELQKFV